MLHDFYSVMLSYYVIICKHIILIDTSLYQNELFFQYYLVKYPHILAASLKQLFIVFLHIFYHN